MPLVDYASSDEESQSDSETNEKKEKKQTEIKQVSEPVETKDAADDESTELFSSLPKPRKTFSFLEDDNKLSKLLLNKNSVSAGTKTNVKITVPSVSEFDNETEGTPPKKIKPSSKGAGLFSVLPPPKNAVSKVTNTSFVPQAVSQSVKKSVTNTKNVIKKYTKTSEVDEDDDDVAIGTSFFGSSLNEQPFDSEPLKISNDNISLDGNVNNSAVGSSSFKEDFSQHEQNLSPAGLYINTSEDQPMYPLNPTQEPETFSASDNPLKLDEKALQILCGNKKKRHQMPMNIIDLSGEEVLPDSKEWLLKQFTEEKRGRSHSHKKSHGPSSMSRRKHQITYLAYQAKEQELELQNQWAQNRMSRKQTQSKYGF